MRHLTRSVALAIGMALVLAGCQDPYAVHQARHRRPVDTAPRLTGRATEPPGPPAGKLLAAAQPAASAQQAVARFAATWVNWDWRTAARQQRELARLAGGPLAADLRRGPQSVAADGSLARDKPGSRGTVIAITIRHDGHGDDGVVVTREQSYAAGHADLGGARYRVYLVRVARSGVGWGVTRWAPQQ